MKRVLRITILVVIGVIFISTIVFLYMKSEEKPKIYKTEKPFITNIVKKTVATGSVVPRKEIEIKPTVSGIIDKIYVEAGKLIRKGDLIAKVTIIPDMLSLNNAESRLKQAEIKFQDVELVYKRQKELNEKGVIAKAEFQKNELDFISAKEEVEAAENNLQLIKEGALKKSGKTTNTLIRSTIDGMVLDVPVEEGNSVIESNTFNAGTTIAIVADMNDIIFKGKVDETEVGKIRQGMNLLLRIGAIENDTFYANLEYIAPKGVEENGAIQFEIKADVKLKEKQFIRAGYSANADIVLDRKDQVLAVKESLVDFEGDSAFVELETGPQTFKKINIKMGLSDGINVEVLEGLDTTSVLKAGILEEKEEKKENN
ncbi:MAG: efflux RND transporter periplasmic adaptor subunit [Bacteroidales bacterium]|nr:efflux RND transporter periplasmic adaptor subunit [Bacteroidales bacterium]